MMSHSDPRLTAADCKRARLELELGVHDLARLASMSVNTVARFERGEATFPRTAVLLRLALEKAGARFGQDAAAVLAVRS